MSRELHVHFLPALFEPGCLRGGTAVMIDVLRASTTILHALDAGAEAVVPFEKIDEARNFAANHEPGRVVLGGERQGELIEGFDLDNSPFSYTHEAVGGKLVAFTTTNGTRALLRSHEADRILIGAFVNLRAVVETLVAGPRPIHLVCAGTQGQITTEDVLCAGAIAAEVEPSMSEGVEPDDQRTIAVSLWSQLHANDALFMTALRSGRGGRNLLKAGCEQDINRAAERDRFNLVPEFQSDTRRITTPNGN